jgi:hypothetical protein
MQHEIRLEGSCLVETVFEDLEVECLPAQPKLIELADLETC